MRSTWPMGRRRPSSGLPAPIAVAPGDRLVLRRGAGADRIVGGLVIDAAAGPGRLASPPDRRTGRAPGRGGRSRRRRWRPRRAARSPWGPRRRGRPVGHRRRSGCGRHGRERRSSRAVVDEASLDDVRATAARTVRRAATIDRTAASPSEASSSPRSSGTAGWCATAPRSDRPARARRRPRRIHTWRPRWIAWKPPWRSRRRPPLAAAARAAGCPADGIRELVRSGRIVELEPDLAYAATTYGELADRALAWPRPSR